METQSRTLKLGDLFPALQHYCPHDPHANPRQAAFLLCPNLEAFYGGAAGGGKSDALLMDALRFVEVAGYAALLLRRTYADLALPGALMDRAKEWLAGTDARWSEVLFRFTFPSSATLTFGYLQTSRDKYRYASAEFQFVGFDELTQFPVADYRFLFSRLRRPALVDEDGKPLDLSVEERIKREQLSRVPLRMRAASNPGGRSHEAVRRRFIERLPDPDDPEDSLEKCRRRIFIPAKLEDNPHVDRASYEEMLTSLDRVDRARLREGDWYADDGTKFFRASDLDAVEDLGRELDYLAERGELQPPAGELLAMGVDHGEHTAYVIGYPLERGGMYIVLAEELLGLEPSQAANIALDAVATVPAWEGLGVVREPLELVEEVRYDAAGIQSQRTFNAQARRRLPAFKAKGIAFGSYKRETAGYLKWLIERTGEGKDVAVLAISERAGKLLRDLRGLNKNPRDGELWLKAGEKDQATGLVGGDDHGPDAFVALMAPVARRNRARR